MQATAKVFKNGGSQAIRLPRQFRFPGKTVTVMHTKDGVLIKYDKDLERRARIFASLAGSCPKFPEIETNTTPDLPREPLA